MGKNIQSLKFLILIFSVSLLVGCGSSTPATTETASASSDKPAKKSSLRTDTDGDGVPDYQDRCPDVKGSKENNGCAFIDSDKDGVADEKDKCPNQSETMNGYLDDDGCPDIAPPPVEEKKIEEVKKDTVAAKVDIPVVAPPIITAPVILPSPITKAPEPKVASNLVQPITMNFPNGSTTMKREQVDALLGVVKTLGQKSAKATIEISVNCWETADAAKNLKLAQKRADLISKFLSQNGIKANRISVTPSGAKPTASSTGNQYYEAKYSE